MCQGIVQLQELIRRTPQIPLHDESNTDSNLHGNKCYLKRWGINIHREAVQIHEKKNAFMAPECTEACLQKSVCVLKNVWKTGDD